ncbi:MAG: hypothetical protein C0404_11005 [Verrucomicrobia bacterium]|nr:hypothetical protein [Verrucomicrobiota bacterium]
MRKWVAVLLPLALAAIFSVQLGCDKGSTDGKEFRINPDKVTMYLGDTTVAFGAVGGHEPFTWKVTDKTLGDISGGGATVTYTRTTKTGNNELQITDSLGWTASAMITQSSLTNRVEHLTISPTTASLDNDGDRIVFAASGGDGNYSWDVGIDARGKVEKSGYVQAVYTRLASGDNTVLLIDGDGRVAVADITQPAASPLAISPSSASVSSNGATQVFSASGGGGSYTWSMVSAPAHGSLSPGPPFTGSSIVYTSAAGDDNSDVISCTDGSTTAFVTINKN